jgi:hypothetical protein
MIKIQSVLDYTGQILDLDLKLHKIKIFEMFIDSIKIEQVMGF